MNQASGSLRSIIGPSSDLNWRDKIDRVREICKGKSSKVSQDDACRLHRRTHQFSNRYWYKIHGSFNS